MNKKWKLTIVSIFSMIMISCDRIWEENQRKKAEDNYTSPFVGTYSGKIDGFSLGQMTIKVSKSGYVSGNINYDGTSDILSGAVLDAGALQSVTTVNGSGFTFYGSMKELKGNWKRNGQTGNWSVAKEN